MEADFSSTTSTEWVRNVVPNGTTNEIFSQVENMTFVADDRFVAPTLDDLIEALPALSATEIESGLDILVKVGLVGIADCPEHKQRFYFRVCACGVPPTLHDYEGETIQ